ncbi:histidine phosphatase family protein [Thermaerobacillus caldiproteolyticus]|uniref:Broad specificity phosphatase PhoE n=1 Tax=Thermaerobacillus caldiproteolyticus TaxID=247480 RepID=A0A7V9Z6W8_9BACL|nr:histidine phosphatase family protein [Anoxybacillus caldiproteolyticus]MBA2875192.1 broad specificity phosphatase PhoE [Anoxybacillus caldiproteolyticus]QPA32862.1 histidine phosphatase family protein [Anoxybacillus caldiproteolyticus]
MEITLIRHGKSEWQEQRWMRPAEFAEWVKAYDEHGICEDDKIPLLTLQKAKNANMVITSILRRAVHSAERLRPSCPVETSELFREVEMPIPFAHVNLIRLPTNIWLIFSRLCWLCGYNGNVESYWQAKQRAEKAAIVLCRYAKTYGNVVVIGHGWFHRLVGKQLRKQGWKRTTAESAKHWHAVSYTLYNK